MKQPDLIHQLIESAARLSKKSPGWHNPPVRPIIGDAPIGEVLHFKSRADRNKADAALTKLKSKGEAITKEDLGRVVKPFTHAVPIWRGATKETAARITEILAPEKETTDAPRK